MSTHNQRPPSPKFDVTLWRVRMRLSSNSDGEKWRGSRNWINQEMQAARTVLLKSSSSLYDSRPIMPLRIAPSKLRHCNAERICVIKPSALGDVVQSLPLLTVLRRRFP